MQLKDSNDYANLIILDPLKFLEKNMHKMSTIIRPSVALCFSSWLLHRPVVEV
jgi:hypothetical protein